MLVTILGIFIVLHGLVHLLYFGHAQRLFELSTGMIWPDNSWAFSKLLGDEGTRVLASVLLVLAALGFVTGGVAVLAKQAWWRPAVVGAAAFAAVVYLLLWDGGLRNLDDQGGIGMLIDIAILVAVLIARWPAFEF